MTPFALNALRPTAAVQAVKPSLASDAGLPTAGGPRSAAFAQLLTQHQAAPVNPAAQAAPRPAAAQPAQPAPPAAAPAPERSATPPHEHAAAAHATDTAEPAATAHEAATAAADDASSDASPADAAESPTATASNTRGTTRGAKGTANARPATGTAHPSSAHEADAGGLAATGERADTQRTDDAASANPLAALVPGWTAPTVPGSATAFAPGAAAGEHAATATASAGSDAATGAADHGALSGIGIGNTHDPRAQPGRPTDDARQASIALPSGTTALAHDAANALPAVAAQALAEREPGSSGAHTGSAPLGDFASQLAQLSGPTGATPGASAAAPVDVQVMTPATAPEFPDALGVQVSLLAQDGVQHAELHLNPAEMGPISVRIAIEGQQAQIDFGADSAHTRQILEAGLPELASALRDAGLTLSGGGVSQHPQPQQQGGRDASDSHGNDRGSSARLNGAGKDTAGALAPLSAAQTRSLARRAAGGIDAYA